MQRSDSPPASSGSFVPLMLAFVVLSAAIAVLSFLTLGFVGVILASAFALRRFCWAAVSALGLVARSADSRKAKRRASVRAGGD